MKTMFKCLCFLSILTKIKKLENYTALTELMGREVLIYYDRTINGLVSVKRKLAKLERYWPSNSTSRNLSYRHIHIRMKLSLFKVINYSSLYERKKSETT